MSCIRPRALSRCFPCSLPAWLSTFPTCLSTFPTCLSTGRPRLPAWRIRPLRRLPPLFPTPPRRSIGRSIGVVPTRRALRGSGHNSARALLAATRLRFFPLSSIPDAWAPPQPPAPPPPQYPCRSPAPLPPRPAATHSTHANRRRPALGRYQARDAPATRVHAPSVSLCVRRGQKMLRFPSTSPAVAGPVAPQEIQPCPCLPSAPVLPPLL